jgi:hypothetical protein
VGADRERVRVAGVQRLLDRRAQQVPAVRLAADRPGPVQRHRDRADPAVGVNAGQPVRAVGGGHVQGQ